MAPPAGASGAPSTAAAEAGPPARPQHPAPRSWRVLRLATARAALTGLAMAALLCGVSRVVFKTPDLEYWAALGASLGLLAGAMTLVEAAAARRAGPISLWAPAALLVALTGAVPVLVVQSMYAAALLRGGSVEHGISVVGESLARSNPRYLGLQLAVIAAPLATSLLVLGLARLHGLGLAARTALVVLASALAALAGLTVWSATTQWVMPLATLVLPPTLAATIGCAGWLAEVVTGSRSWSFPPPVLGRRRRRERGGRDTPWYRARTPFDPLLGVGGTHSYYAPGDDVPAGEEPDGPGPSPGSPARLAEDRRCSACQADLSGGPRPAFCFHCGEAFELDEDDEGEDDEDEDDEE